MNIAVEIGAYGIKVAIQNNGKVEMVKLGDSLSPYIIPSLAYVAKSGQIIFGNLAELCDINNGERIYLSEMMPSDNKTEEIYEKLFAFIKDLIVSSYKQAVSNVTMIVPPYFQSVDPRKKVMREAWMHNGIYNLDFISSDVSTCYRKLNLSNNESALVFDIGYNGTVISVVKRNKNVFRSIANKYIKSIGGTSDEKIERRKSYNTCRSSSYNSCTFDFSRSYNKLSSRAKWNNCKSKRSSTKNRKCNKK